MSVHSCKAWKGNVRYLENIKKKSSGKGEELGKFEGNQGEIEGKFQR